MKASTICGITIATGVAVWRLWKYVAAKKQEEIDVQFMSKALEFAYLSEPIGTAYCVGCVIVRDGCIVSSGYSRELTGNTHAEECALTKLGKQLAEGTDVYTTMEPCSQRLSGKVPCVQWCIDYKVKRVIIGAMEPDLFVSCTGLQKLDDAGIQVVVLSGMQSKCLQPNRHLDIKL